MDSSIALCGKNESEATVGVRNSSIELLKVISIFLIVISHVAQTLCTKSSIEANNGYVYLLQGNGVNFTSVVLLLFNYFGIIGNVIFISSSIWFMIDKDKVNWKNGFSLFLKLGLFH